MEGSPKQQRRRILLRRRLFILLPVRQFTEECEFQWVQCRCKDRQIDSLLLVPGGEAVWRDAEQEAVAEPAWRVAEQGAAEPVGRVSEPVERRDEEPERR